MLAGKIETVHAILVTDISYLNLDNHEVKIKKDTPIVVDPIKNIALINGDHVEVFQTEYIIMH